MHISEIAKDCFKCGDEIYYWSREFNKIEKRKVKEVSIKQMLNYNGNIIHIIEYNFEDAFPEEYHVAVREKLCAKTIEELLNKLKSTFREASNAK